MYRSYLFLERVEGRKKENMNGLPLVHFPAGDLAYNPGRCPDWESNL